MKRVIRNSYKQAAGIGAMLLVWIIVSALSWDMAKIRINQTAQRLGLPESSTAEGDSPSEEDRLLLLRFRPRMFVAPNGDTPIDFYDDYLPHTTLKSRSDKALSEKPSRERLVEIAGQSEFYLDYEGPVPLTPVLPSVYARIRREPVNVLVENQFHNRSFTLLSYNFIFLRRGLPKQTAHWKERLAGFFGSAETWQEFDSQGALHLVLNEKIEIVSAVLVQYGLHRTFVRDLDFQVPPDGRVKIVFSERSNQPYWLPESDTPVQRRAVRDMKDISFLMVGGREPFFAGIDILYSPVSGAREMEYMLAFLPKFDPLFTARFLLGAPVFLPGGFEINERRPSVGIYFETWPELVDLGNWLSFGYFKDGDRTRAEFMKNNVRSETDITFDSVILRNGAFFGRDLTELEKKY